MEKTMLRIDTTSHAIQNLDSDHKEKIMEHRYYSLRSGSRPAEVHSLKSPPLGLYAIPILGP